MDALVAALACSLMMVAAVSGFVWYAARGRRSAADATEVTALRAEMAKLRQSEPDTPPDEVGG